MRTPNRAAGLAWLCALWWGLLLLSPQSAADEPRVWVNTSSGIYHCPGSQYYGNTKRGKYLAEADATASGYRAAYGRRCSSSASRAGQSPPVQTALSQPAGGDSRVWVNTSSGVYHCPGTRYYGATKRGRYLSEADAISSGNRPAHGKRCGG